MSSDNADRYPVPQRMEDDGENGIIECVSATVLVVFVLSMMKLLGWTSVSWWAVTFPFWGMFVIVVI